MTEITDIAKKYYNKRNVLDCLGFSYGEKYTKYINEIDIQQIT